MGRFYEFGAHNILQSEYKMIKDCNGDDVCGFHYIDRVDEELI